MWKAVKSFFLRYAITVSITVVGLLIAQNAYMSYLGKQAIQTRNNAETAYRTINDILATHTIMINLLDLGLRGFYMMKRENFADPYNIAMEHYANNLNALRDRLSELNYPHLDNVDELIKKTEEYANLVSQGIDLMHSGQYEQAVQLFESDPGYQLYISTNPIIENINGYVSNLNEQAKAKYEEINGYTMASQIFTVVLGIPVLIIVLVRLTRQENRILRLFTNLDKSNQEYILKENTTSKASKNILKRGLVINKIISNLKNASTFIQNIAQGNLDVTWEGMDEEARANNSGTIAGQLLQMRDQLISVKESDDRRKWVTEGVANFSDLVREHKDDFDVLTKKVISFVVKYTKSNQGGLYLLNDTEDEDYIELASCYAYDKHKHIDQKIPYGVGLIGEVFKEGETAIYKDIPEDYINITSGLGEALPRNLIMIPIKTDDHTLGVIELASFQLFLDHHIRFLERIALALASEVASSKSNTLTKQLLESSKENEEMMRAQEEEMRQNMEELQATQEEQERQRRELQDKIRELEEKLANR